MTGGPAALVAVLAKLKAVIFVVLKLKFFATAGTAFVSVGAYSLLFGWSFAAGFVVLLFVHEMGHVVQLRREGIKASAPMFVPFLGAVVWARSMGTNALAEARVGLAGPVLGTVGAGIVALAAVVTERGHRNQVEEVEQEAGICQRVQQVSVSGAGRWLRWPRPCGWSASSSSSRSPSCLGTR